MIYRVTFFFGAEPKTIAKVKDSLICLASRVVTYLFDFSQPGHQEHHIFKSWKVALILGCLPQGALVLTKIKQLLKKRVIHTYR